MFLHGTSLIYIIQFIRWKPLFLRASNLNVSCFDCALKCLDFCRCCAKDEAYIRWSERSPVHSGFIIIIFTKVSLYSTIFHKCAAKSCQCFICTFVCNTFFSGILIRNPFKCDFFFIKDQGFQP